MNLEPENQTDSTEELKQIEDLIELLIEDEALDDGDANNGESPSRS